MILEKAISGDSKAFEELMNKYMKNIYNYLLLKISNKEDVKDVMQETIFAIWKNLKNFKRNSSFKTWVIGIAKNKTMDLYRYKYNKSFQTVEMKVIENTEFSKDEINTVLDKVDIESSIETLSDGEKELLHLIFNCQFSYGEIEELTGIPKGTIKSRFYHLKKKMKPLLEERR